VAHSESVSSSILTLEEESSSESMTRTNGVAAIVTLLAQGPLGIGVDSDSEPEVAGVFVTGIATLCVGIIARVVDGLGTQVPRTRLGGLFLYFPSCAS